MEALPLEDGGLSDRVFPFRTTRDVAGVSANDFHRFARRLVGDAGFGPNLTQRGPTLHGLSGSANRRLAGFVAGERDLANAQGASRTALRTAIGLVAAGVAVLVVLAFVGSKYFGSGGVALGIVVAAPILAFGITRLGSTRSFESNVVCVSYTGPTPAAVGQARYEQPTSFRVTVSAGRVGSANVRTSSGKGLSLAFRLVRSVITPSPPELALLPEEIAGRIPEGRDIPKDAPDPDDPF